MMERIHINHTLVTDDDLIWAMSLCLYAYLTEQAHLKQISTYLDA